MREENIEKMNFKELRSEVQYLRDELAIFKRKYEDAIYNLDGDNFGKSFAPLLWLWRNHLFPRTVRLSCSFQRYSRPLLISVSPCVRRKSSKLTAFARSICAWVYCMGVLLTS